MANIADYDVVILETSSLASILDTASKENDSKLLQQINDKLINIKYMLMSVLDSEGRIYVICSPEVRIFYGKAQREFINNYAWSPFPIYLRQESGVTIYSIKKSFEKYFQYVKSWTFCFENLDYKQSNLDVLIQFHHGQYYIEPLIEIIAENRYKKPISMRMSYNLHKPIDNIDIYQSLVKTGHVDDRKFHSKVELSSGTITLLPPPTEINPEEAINLILEDLYGIRQKTYAPQEIAEIFMPGESKLNQSTKERNNKIDGLKNEISEIEKTKSELTKFKALLYETDTFLEDICKLTLNKLGCRIDDSYEDFLVIKDNKEAIIEVKGREKVIERKDGGQLSQNKRQYIMTQGKELKEVKAILLGNPWRLVFPIEERNKNDLFAPQLINDAKNDEMALVTTPDLFKAYCAFLEGKVSSDDIVNQLFSGIGITKLIE
jgi:hypothetical protein